MVWPGGVGRRSRATVGDRGQQGGRESAARRSYSSRHVAAQAPAQAASSPVRTAGRGGPGDPQAAVPRGHLLGTAPWAFVPGPGKEREQSCVVFHYLGKPREMNFQVTETPQKSHWLQHSSKLFK